MSTPYNFEMPNRVPLERAIADVKLPRKTIHEFMWMCEQSAGRASLQTYPHEPFISMSALRRRRAYGFIESYRECEPRSKVDRSQQPSLDVYPQQRVQVGG